jgi:hypothetical protein
MCRAMPPGWLLRVLFVAAVGSTAIGCQVADSESTAAEAVACPPKQQSGAITDRARLEAMLSVHAHVEVGADKPLPGELRCLMPLKDAVLILKEDRGSGAWSRRRRAIAELIAHRKSATDFESELKGLGANVQAIHPFGSKKPPGNAHLVQPLGTSGAVVKSGESPASLEVEVTNLLADKPELAGESDSEEKECKWHKEGDANVGVNGGAVVIDAKVSIPEPMTVEDVAKNIDPQRWDNCSLFWDPPEDATFLAESGQPHTKPPKRNNPPAPGTPHPALPLFELFTAPGIGATFENVLTITMSTGVVDEQGKDHPEGRHMRYDLAKDGFISARVDGQDTTVIIDSGFVDAWKDGNRVFVKSHKQVQYGNAAFNSSSNVALTITHKELADQLGELACCRKSNH